MNKDISAFPTAQYADGVRPSGFDNGMTLRDYFAAKAMQAFLTSNRDLSWQELGALSYDAANAMMKARGA